MPHPLEPSGRRPDHDLDRWADDGGPCHDHDRDERLTLRERVIRAMIAEAEIATLCASINL